MYSFSSPGILKDAFDVTVARDGHKWLLVTPKGNGFLETRQLAHLNHSTTSEAATWSETEHPCFWFDSDWDRRPQPWSDLLAALLTIEPKAPLRRTGRTQKMTAEMGGEREAAEVEVMVDEDELCKVCYYCGELQSDRLGEEAFSKVAGDGFTSTYSCPAVRSLEGSSPFSDTLRFTVHRVADEGEKGAAR
ncbi:hypothetical protein C8F04DRAFT_1098169 [Mycena alexandri]|uniref:Uncharacterized protein n=1 Tax=Mycena alexandri TaxID=1745969 RepID=A0AAD6X5I4_9AGAR|nr:hypothetical protein C8F04DRAFT_1098169 [Mycena alexandri]